MLARLFPGIPGDYRDWPEEEKEAWLANVPAVLAWEQRKLRSIDAKTKEGVYNAVLAETDDQELAMKARTEFWTNTKLANLQGAQ